MSNTEKIKRIILIAIGFGFATYLMMSGIAILDKNNNRSSEKKGLNKK